ncbi:unnamed protein product [Pylaiella littoralis]
MITPCAAPGCEELSSQRCSSCKSVRYCSRECQRRDWAVEHKENCAYLAQQRRAAGMDMDPDQSETERSTVRCVNIFDSKVKEKELAVEQLPPARGGNGWELCPVVALLGLPLAIKKVAPCGCQVCVGSHSSIPEPMNQVATRLAIEPHNGLAPPRWQGGGSNHLGTVEAGRTDGRDFTGQDWAILDDYIYNNIFDVWGMDPYERQQQLPGVYSAQSYARYAAVRNEEAGASVLSGGFMG